jgi:hypothetical protein
MIDDVQNARLFILSPLDKTSGKKIEIVEGRVFWKKISERKVTAMNKLIGGFCMDSLLERTNGVK